MGLYAAWKSDMDRIRVGEFSYNGGLVNSSLLHETMFMNCSLAVFQDRLYLGWDSPSPDRSIYVMSSDDGVKFENKIKIDKVDVKAGPCLYVDDSQLLVAWGVSGAFKVTYSDDGANFKPIKTISTIIGGTVSVARFPPE